VRKLRFKEKKKGRNGGQRYGGKEWSVDCEMRLKQKEIKKGEVALPFVCLGVRVCCICVCVQ
jgi:hypothetical protein